MDAFVQQTAAWQTFFITLTGMGTTLADPLFVAISLHPVNQDEGAKTDLRRLADRALLCIGGLMLYLHHSTWPRGGAGHDAHVLGKPGSAHSRHA